MKTQTITQDQIASFDDFKKLVDTMEVEVDYIMPDSFTYEKISIDKEGRGEYCWTMTRKIAGYVFPMKNGRLVQTFKTIAGAKRSLVRHCEFIFKNK
jgi:hypothetical protein